VVDIEELEKILASEPTYRLCQAKQALFQDLVTDWQQAIALPAALRAELTKACPLAISHQLSTSADGQTTKCLITLDDGEQIEAVLMRHDDRRTVCVSQQVGCALGCRFCLTGQMGFRRNLSVSEIVAQVLLFARREKVTNIVFMGMGEPLLNYDNVLAAIRILNDPDGFNMGARRISISTVGIVPGIRRLAEENLQVNLAVSLHAPNDKLRSELLPVNGKYPLAAVLRAVDDYIKKTNRRVMVEYLLLAGINDSASCAQELATLLSGRLCFVNLISYNVTAAQFKPSPPEKVRQFKKTLEGRGLTVTQRYRFGRNIKAACGQLGVGT